MFSSFARARALRQELQPAGRAEAHRPPERRQHAVEDPEDGVPRLELRVPAVDHAEDEGPGRAGLGDPVRQLGSVGEVEPDEVHGHRHEIVPERERVPEEGVERQVGAPARRRQRGDPLADEVGVLRVPEEIGLVHLDQGGARVDEVGDLVGEDLRVGARQLAPVR